LAACEKFWAQGLEMSGGHDYFRTNNKSTMAKLQASRQKQRIPKFFINEILEQPDLFRAVRLVLFAHFYLDDTLSMRSDHTRQLLSKGFSHEELIECINILLDYEVIEMTSPDVFKTIDIESKYDQSELIDGFVSPTDLTKDMLLVSDNWEVLRVTMLSIHNDMDQG
jgi:hypothetical protein